MIIIIMIVMIIPSLWLPQNRRSRKRHQRRAWRFIGQGDVTTSMITMMIIISSLQWIQYDHWNNYNLQALALEKSVAELSVKAVQSEQDVVGVIILIITILIIITILVIIIQVIINLVTHLSPMQSTSPPSCSTFLWQTLILKTFPRRYPPGAQ